MLLSNLLKHASPVQAMKSRLIAVARGDPLPERVSLAPHRSQQYFHLSTFSSLQQMAESLHYQGEKKHFPRKNPPKNEPMFLLLINPRMEFRHLATLNPISFNFSRTRDT